MHNTTFKLLLLALSFIILAIKVDANDSINSAIIEAAEQIKKERQSGEKEKYREAIFQLGVAYMENGFSGEAYEQFKLYIEEIEKNEDQDELVKAHAKVGSIYKEKMVFDIALEFYLQALSHSKNKVNLITANIHRSIGGIYYDQENFDKSEEFYQKALDGYTKSNARNEVAASYNNLGEIFRFRKEYDSALKFYFSSVEINKEFSNTYYLAINYNNIGDVYLSQRKFEKAFSYLDSCRKLFERLEHKEMQAASHTSLADYYFAIGDYNQSIENYSLTLSFDSIESPKKDIIKMDAYLGLSNAFSKIGNIDKSFEYYKKYIELKDIVFNSEKHKAIFEVQTKYETRQKEKEIVYLHDKAEREAEKKQIFRTSLIISIGLSCFVILLMIYSYLLKSKSLKQKTLLFEQSNKLNKLEIENKEIENKKLQLENKELEAKEEIARLKSEKLETELSNKERELSTTALHVMNKNEMLSALKKSMEQLIKGSNTDPNYVMAGLIREIDNNINLDKDWETFKLHFDKVHPGFFLRLKNQYTELTPDELKLCAYLRINLSSKEIAQILNVTQVAINKRRNRLRKKLTLNATDDLFDFMCKI